MKKNSNNKYNNPFSNEIKQSKHAFTKMIDKMSDEEFVHFMLMFMDFVEDLADFEDESFEDDDCEFLPF